MRNRWRSILSIAAIAVLSAACSSATTSTPSAMASSVPSAASESPATSPAGSVGGVSAAPSESASASSSGLESASPAASSSSAPASPMTSADLQAALPKQVGSKTLTVKSATAAELPMFTGDAGAAALGVLTAALKITPDQVQAALATASDKSVTIAAMSVGGVDATSVQNAVYSVLATTSNGVTSSPATVGGKSVTQLQNLDTPKVTIYIYTKDSAVYVIWVNDAKLGEDALSKLP